jgi:hypothetical protein
VKVPLAQQLLLMQAKELDYTLATTSRQHTGVRAGIRSPADVCCRGTAAVHVNVSRLQRHRGGSALPDRQPFSVKGRDCGVAAEVRRNSRMIPPIAELSLRPAKAAVSPQILWIAHIAR